MPSAKEIKSRIASIKDTQKITNAMYLISSTKLRKAKNELNRTRPYFDALKGEIKRIFRTVPDVDSRYFYPPAGAPKLEGGGGMHLCPPAGQCNAPTGTSARSRPASGWRR